MLAIIIPYYKIKFFEETLKSLANQSDKRFKVYIGDDASPEDPVTILEKYKGQVDFEYHRFGDNLGSYSLTQQWERCIALSKDEQWLMILGDDDVLGKEVISEWYRNFNLFKNKTNVVRFSTIIVNHESQFLTSFYHHPEWENVTDFYFRKIRGITRSSLSEYFFSRKSFLKYKFRDYPVAWHSDDAAWFDFSEGKSIYTINNELVYIRVSDVSISGQQNNLKEKSEATFKFYHYLLTSKVGLFSKFQKEELFKRISKSYLNDKKNIKYFFKISIICFKNNDFKQYCNFILSVLYSLKISLNTLKNKRIF
ncbi:glycosyltransferase family 2 protein [Flavobacterium sp. ALJ2]|uniref:glycosyltransferase family 2 protein n=1 Tax=Flavobacterium sp. ALJ2 TaxID=2786960 RepID=UPI00189C8B81|nr:glycosyltransferase family A protein [Flavobacterium sp. ALJ2]MBF7090626.1 glycosyltransferase family 2 protein [Flavobacterium sp. ALJ2]